MRPFKLLSVLILATLVVATSTFLPGSTQEAAAEVDVYTTPGTHHVNGREWRTTCESYSQTQRCRTEIHATQVTQVRGVFKARTGWFFNNLTYVASPRSLWADNPLGNAGAWTATDGRHWRTDCDVPSTGSNGCRSYIKADVIEGYLHSGTWHYRRANNWVFNNMVRFSSDGAMPPSPQPTATVTTTSAPTPTPTVTVTVTSTPTSDPLFLDPATIEDPALRECIADELGLRTYQPMPKAALANVTRLQCPNRGIESLRGMPEMQLLEQLVLAGNDLPTLDGFTGQPALKFLQLQENHLENLLGMPELTTLEGIDLADNRLMTLAHLPVLPALKTLHLKGNRLADLQGMPDLAVLENFVLDDNQLTTLAHLPVLPELRTLDVLRNMLPSLSGMPTQPELTGLYLTGNELTTLVGMQTHPKLLSLVLSENDLVSPEGLPELPALNSLHLRSNQLASLTGMRNYPAMRYLYLDDNLLTDLTGLPVMTSPKGLYVRDNQISSVAALAGWTGLEELYLTGNPVTDLNTLDGLVADGLQIHI